MEDMCAVNFLHSCGLIDETTELLGLDKCSTAGCTRVCDVPWLKYLFTRVKLVCILTCSDARQDTWGGLASSKTGSATGRPEMVMSLIASGFFGVFDGHGGQQCSSFVAKRLTEDSLLLRLSPFGQCPHAPPI